MNMRRAVRRAEVPGRKVACELAVSVDFVDPSTRNNRPATMCYSARDAEAVANLFSGFHPRAHKRLSAPDPVLIAPDQNFTFN
jgi:hypothetical protein